MKKTAESKGTNKKRNVYLILGIVFFVAFLVIVALMIRNKILQDRAQQRLEELAAATVDTEESVTEILETETEVERDILAELGIEIPEKNLDWDALHEENGDIYAWIYVPETNIDYPVLQHPTEESYYLNHNLDGSEGYPGCIYTQNLNSKDFTDPNTVIYGHNMKDGSMFRTLHYYEDGVFFEENPYVYIYTPEEIFVYEIFAAYEFSDAHLLYNFDFETPASFQVYLDSVFNTRDMNSHVRQDLTVTSDNHIITMSTCISGKPNNRYLVQAVLLNDPTLE
ncbi:MAG: class B sortase [Roseburia sp.]